MYMYADWGVWGRVWELNFLRTYGVPPWVEDGDRSVYLGMVIVCGLEPRAWNDFFFSL